MFSPIYFVFLANIQSIFPSVVKTKQKLLGSAAQKFNLPSLFGEAETFFFSVFSPCTLFFKVVILSCFNPKN